MARKLWTKEEAEKLINYYETHSTDETVEHYGYANARSLIDAIWRLRKRFAIPKKRRVRWTEEEARGFIEFYKSHSIEKTMKRYNFSRRNSIYRVINRLSKRYNIARE